MRMRKLVGEARLQLRCGPLVEPFWFETGILGTNALVSHDGRPVLDPKLVSVRVVAVVVRVEHEPHRHVFGPTSETTEETFDTVYATNVKVPFVLVAELAPKMADRGRGAIVNVSTMVANFGVAGMALYGSSKAALNLLTKAWAAEFGPKGVRVNAVSPGPTRTEGTAAMEDGLVQLAAAAPAGRPATPDEIADAIVFLVSPDASFVQGVVLPVDGGRLAV